MLDKAVMSRGRYNVALTLLSDRFIFAIGGNVGKNVATEIVECLDTQGNVWYPVASLTKPRSCTSAICVGNRYLYAFPGIQKDTWSSIEFLDLGFFGSKPDPRDFKNCRWNVLQIPNPDLA